MKAQVPGEISLIIVGAIFIWIGITVLGLPTTSSLAGGFDAYLGAGFILAGIVSIIGGALSVLHN
jgi:uncharacterized membrane protein HdeD (DUF308 family)